MLGHMRPRVVVTYAKQEMSALELGLVEAQGRDDANVVVRVPADRSVFPGRQLVSSVGNVEIPLADPAQMIWDLHQLGGTDRLETAGELRDWLFGRWPGRSA